MGEGMSRRMMKAGIEVWGYRRNYAKLKKRLKRVMSVELPLIWKALFKVVHDSGGSAGKCPGIFQLVIPAELVEDTLNELLPLLSDGDIIIDHGNSNFKDSRRRAERLAKLGIQYIDCGTSVEFMVWSVDTVLWLVVQIQQYLYVPPFSGTRTRDFRCRTHRSIQQGNIC